MCWFFGMPWLSSFWESILSCCCDHARSGWGCPCLLTERWGRDPGLFIFAVSLHLFLVNPVQPKMLRNESSSQTWVMRVWKTGKAVKLENWWLDLFTLKSSWRRGDNLKAQSLMNERFWGVVWELFSLSVQGNNKDVQWSWKVAN